MPPVVMVCVEFAPPPIALAVRLTLYIVNS